MQKPDIKSGPGSKSFFVVVQYFKSCTFRVSLAYGFAS